MINRRVDITPTRTVEKIKPLEYTELKKWLKQTGIALDLDYKGDLQRSNAQLTSIDNILQAINRKDAVAMRAISDFFYESSGIYARLCRYLAYLYRYDWMVTPFFKDNAFLQDGNAAPKKKVIDGFNEVLYSLDNFEVKKFFGEVALKVIRNGAYYGYIMRSKDGKSFNVQELPVSHCRSRFVFNGRPMVELRMDYFTQFKDSERDNILKVFPKEIQQAWKNYLADYNNLWAILDPSCAVKFNINGSDFPFLMAVIPAIVDLDSAKTMDKRRIAQKLVKIIVQQIPRDKNNESVFDNDEITALHKSAVSMVGGALGLKVLTTPADVTVEGMEENNSTAADDGMQRIKDSVFDEAGVSQLQFNSNGNIALNNSILNDEATMYNLLTQFESFLNDLIAPFNSTNKKISYRVQILTTTIYNYKEMSKLYKEQTQLGYSKMLPQIALGQSQSSVLANAYFENKILDLSTLFIPPMSSAVMNADSLSALTGKGGGGDVGRPSKPDEQKSDKTIANQESMA